MAVLKIVNSAIVMLLLTGTHCFSSAQINVDAMQLLIERAQKLEKIIPLIEKAGKNIEATKLKDPHNPRIKEQEARLEELQKRVDELSNQLLQNTQAMNVCPTKAAATALKSFIEKAKTEEEHTIGSIQDTTKAYKETASKSRGLLGQAMGAVKGLLAKCSIQLK